MELLSSAPSNERHHFSEIPSATLGKSAGGTDTTSPTEIRIEVNREACTDQSTTSRRSASCAESLLQTRRHTRAHVRTSVALLIWIRLERRRRLRSVCICLRVCRLCGVQFAAHTRTLTQTDNSIAATTLHTHRTMPYVTDCRSPQCSRVRRSRWIHASVSACLLLLLFVLPSVVDRRVVACAVVECPARVCLPIATSSLLFACVRVRMCATCVTFCYCLVLCDTRANRIGIGHKHFCTHSTVAPVGGHASNKLSTNRLTTSQRTLVTRACRW